MTLPIRNTKVRIDFVVREVCYDRSVPEDDLKYIRFGDEVGYSSVRDFFERCGHAMGLMFTGTGAQTLVFDSIGQNKINVIKVVRELTCWGLKEAKDMVEAPIGTPFMVVKNHDDMVFVCKAIAEAGGRLSAINFQSEHLNPRMTPPTPVEYARMR